MGNRTRAGRGVDGRPGRRYELSDDGWERIAPLLLVQGRGGKRADHRHDGRHGAGDPHSYDARGLVGRRWQTDSGGTTLDSVSYSYTELDGLRTLTQSLPGQSDFEVQYPWGVSAPAGDRVSVRRDWSILVAGGVTVHGTQNLYGSSGTLSNSLIRPVGVAVYHDPGSGGVTMSTQAL